LVYDDDALSARLRSFRLHRSDGRGREPKHVNSQNMHAFARTATHAFARTLAFICTHCMKGGRGLRCTHKRTQRQRTENTICTHPERDARANVLLSAKFCTHMYIRKPARSKPLLDTDTAAIANLILRTNAQSVPSQKRRGSLPSLSLGLAGEQQESSWRAA
jgi:hypothetical protein